MKTSPSHEPVLNSPLRREYDRRLELIEKLCTEHYGLKPEPSLLWDETPEERRANHLAVKKMATDIYQLVIKRLGASLSAEFFDSMMSRPRGRQRGVKLEKAASQRLKLLEAYDRLQRARRQPLTIRQAARRLSEQGGKHGNSQSAIEKALQNALRDRHEPTSLLSLAKAATPAATNKCGI